MQLAPLENAVSHLKFVMRSMYAPITLHKNLWDLSIGLVHIHCWYAVLKISSCLQMTVQRALLGLGAATNRNLPKAQCADTD